jgi:hypothetical protein
MFSLTALPYLHYIQFETFVNRENIGDFGFKSIHLKTISQSTDRPIYQSRLKTKSKNNQKQSANLPIDQSTNQIQLTDLPIKFKFFNANFGLS